MKNFISCFQFVLILTLSHLLSKDATAARVGEQCNLTNNLCETGSYCDLPNATISPPTSCRGEYASCLINSECCSGECLQRGPGSTKSCEPIRICHACVPEFHAASNTMGCCPGLMRSNGYCMDLAYVPPSPADYPFVVDDQCRIRFTNPSDVSEAESSRLYLYAFEMLFLSRYSKIQNDKNEWSHMNFNANGHDIAKAHFMYRMPHGKKFFEKTADIRERLRNVNNKTGTVEYYLGLGQIFLYRSDYFAGMARLYANLGPMFRPAIEEIREHYWGSSQFKCSWTTAGNREDEDYGDYCDRKCWDRNVCCHNIVHRSDEMCVKSCLKITDTGALLVDPMLPQSTERTHYPIPAFSDNRSHIKHSLSDSENFFSLLSRTGQMGTNFRFKLPVPVSSLVTTVANGRLDPTRHYIVDHSFCHPHITSTESQRCLWTGEINTVNEPVTVELKMANNNLPTEFSDQDIHLNNNLEFGSISMTGLKDHLKSAFKTYAQNNYMDLFSPHENDPTTPTYDELETAAGKVYDLLVAYSFGGYSGNSHSYWKHECNYDNDAENQLATFTLLKSAVVNHLAKFYNSSALAWKQASRCMLEKANEIYIKQVNGEGYEGGDNPDEGTDQGEDKTSFNQNFTEKFNSNHEFFQFAPLSEQPLTKMPDNKNDNSGGFADSFGGLSSFSFKGGASSGQGESKGSGHLGASKNPFNSAAMNNYAISKRYLDKQSKDFLNKYGNTKEGQDIMSKGGVMANLDNSKSFGGSSGLGSSGMGQQGQLSSLGNFDSTLNGQWNLEGEGQTKGAGAAGKGSGKDAGKGSGGAGGLAGGSAQGNNSLADYLKSLEGQAGANGADSGQGGKGSIEEENMRKFLSQQSDLSIQNKPGESLFEVISKAYVKHGLKRMLVGKPKK